jgi:hypothetical protein
MTAILRAAMEDCKINASIVAARMFTDRRGR